MLDKRRGIGQVPRLICKFCKSPMLHIEEKEFNDGALKSLSEGKPAAIIPLDVSRFCQCPENGRGVGWVESVVKLEDGRYFARPADEYAPKADGYYEIPIYEEHVTTRKDGTIGDTAPHAICLAFLKAKEKK
jgi:hypothetical protein